MNNNKLYRAILIVYQLIIFWPLGVATTVLCALAAILIAPIFGDRNITYYPGRIWAKVVCALALVRIKVVGAENYDANKSYIFVANHQSIFDIFMIYGWLDSKFKWIMKQEIRKMPFIGKACESLGHIFIDRSNAKQAQKSINKAIENFKNGSSIVLFPEGTRTRDGSVGKFKKGAFSIAKDIHLPIVPITIKGAYETLPYNGYCIMPNTIEMIIHPPIDTKNLTIDNINDYKTLVENTVKQGLVE